MKGKEIIKAIDAIVWCVGAIVLLSLGFVGAHEMLRLVFHALSHTK